MSFTTQRMSKRDKMGSVSSTLSEKVRDESYLPPTGFAAAMTEHRACSEVTMPALEIEMDCCSIASWMDTRSWSFILSNSSIRQTPLSAMTKAPPCNTHSRVTGSFCTAAVRPTADAPLPVAYTARLAVFSTYFKNWDLATPGSPNRSMLMSPLSLVFPLTIFSWPPKSASAMPALMSSCP